MHRQRQMQASSLWVLRIPGAGTVADEKAAQQHSKLFTVNTQLCMQQCVCNAEAVHVVQGCAGIPVGVQEKISALTELDRRVSCQLQMPLRVH